MSCRKKHRRHEEHTNHEAWAIPYGDLVTLLLAFFVVHVRHLLGERGKVSRAVGCSVRGLPRHAAHHGADPGRREADRLGRGSEDDARRAEHARRTAAQPARASAGANRQTGSSPTSTTDAREAARAAASAQASSVSPMRSCAPWTIWCRRTSSWCDARAP